MALQEERHLLRNHGDAYASYLARIPRFLPHLSQWQDIEVLEVQPDRVVRTFIDACVFLIAIPMAEVFQFIQNTGFIPIFFPVP